MTEQVNLTERDANPLAYEKIPKLLKKYAIPTMLAMVINAIYNIVDQIFIGRGIGYIGNTATTICFPFVTLSNSISLMVAIGCSTFINLKLGEGKREEASRAFGNALTVALACGITVTSLSLIFMQKLLYLFGATAESIGYATDYATIIVLGLPFIMISQTMNNAIRADGNPKYSMISFSSGAILNTILDPIFIFCFHWGVKGAAVATIMGQILSAVIALCYIKRFKHIDIKKEYMKFKSPFLGRILTLGTSSFITQFSGLISQIVLTNTLRYYGELSSYGADIPIAACGITMKVNMLFISALMGLSNGQQPIIGFNYGAKNYDRVRKTYLTTSAIATTISLIGCIVFQLFPKPIVALFGQDDPLYVQFAVRSFTIFLSMVWVAGFQFTTTALFQAIGKPFISIVLTISRQLAFHVPLMIILPIYFGVDGILYSMPATDLAAVAIALIFGLKELKTLKKLQDENNVYSKQ